jgi:hypothetical protein
MKLVLTFLTVLSLFVQCKKDNKLCDTYLTINSTNTPTTTTLSHGIISIVNSYGANLCYQFNGMEITQQPTPSGPVYQFQYFIRVKATLPCDTPICADGIYNSSKTITLNPSVTGTYYLNFYNANQLFKTDTVIVN